MKKLLLSASILFVSFAASAQITFQKSYGELNVDYGLTMVQASDGGYCIVGGTGPDLLDSTDISINRTNVNGDLVWSARLRGTKDDILTGITTTDDGGFIVVGNTFSSPLDTNYSDIIVMKTDDNGFVYWSKTFGGLDIDEAQSVIRSGDGGYILFGSTMSYGSVTKSALAMKIDDLGNQVWTNTNSTFSSNYFYAGDRTSDGNYIAAGGTFNGGGTGFDNYVTKLDTLGNIIWSKSYGTAGAEFLYDIKSTSDGGFILCGVSSSNTAGDADMSIIRLDAAGNIRWNYNYGTLEYDRAHSVIEGSDGNFVIAGYSNIGNSSSVINQMVLLRLDTAGTIQWAQSYGDISLTSEAYKVLEAADGYALCGYSIAFDPLGDSYLVKTDFAGGSGCYEAPISYIRTNNTLAVASGFTENVGLIDEFGTSLLRRDYTTQFSLVCYAVGIGEGPENHVFEIYPNPASSYLMVKTSQEATKSVLKVTDLTGRILIYQDFSNQLEAKIKTDQLITGMYLLSIETDKGLVTKTFIKD